MKHVTSVLIFLCLTLSCGAQVVEESKPLFDHRFSTFRSATSSFDRFFVVTSGGTVNRFSIDLEFEQEESRLKNYYVTEVIGVDDYVVALTAHGVVLSKESLEGEWQVAFRSNPLPYLSSKRVWYGIDDGQIWQHWIVDNEWVHERFSEIPEDVVVKAFAVERDTICIVDSAFNGTVSVYDRDRVFISEVDSLGGVGRFYALNGSVLALADAQLHSVRLTLNVESLLTANAQRLNIDDNTLTIKYPQMFATADSMGVVGYFTTGSSSSPLVGAYGLSAAGTVWPAPYDKDVDKDLNAFSFTNKGFLAGGVGRLVLRNGSNDIKETVFTGLDGNYKRRSETAIIDQTLTPLGELSKEGMSSALLMPYATQQSVSRLELEIKPFDQLFSYFHQFDSGDQLAIFGQSINHRASAGTWSKTWETKGFASRSYVQIVNDSTVALPLEFGKLLYSLDRGENWYHQPIPQYSFNGLKMGDVDGWAAMANYDTVRVLKLLGEEGIEEVRKRHFAIPFTWQFFPSTRNQVVFASGINTNQPGGGEREVSAIVVYQWNLDSDTYDSTLLNIPTIDDSRNILTTTISDTLVVWHRFTNRLILVHQDSVVLDTIYTFEGTRAEGVLTTTDIECRDGLLWLVDHGYDLYVKLNFRGSTTSVERYFPEVYTYNQHPVPTRDVVNVKLGTFPASVKTNLSLILTDVQGSIVRNYTNQLPEQLEYKSDVELTLETSALPDGVYFLVFSNGRTTHTSKIMIQR